jgi:hypothetical protein
VVEFIRDVGDCNKIAPGLHPRTGFLIFFPGIVLICLASLWFVSPNLQKAENMLEGFAFTAAIIALAALYGRFEDLGNAVRWDSKAIYVRQTHPDWGRWGNKGFARIPYDEVEAIVALPSPRGVPPLYPVIEVVVRKQCRPPKTQFTIDPNYFMIAPLLTFLEELRMRAPQVNAEENGERLDKMMRRIQRNKMPWDAHSGH